MLLAPQEDPKWRTVTNDLNGSVLGADLQQMTVVSENQEPGKGSKRHHSPKIFHLSAPEGIPFFPRQIHMSFRCIGAHGFDPSWNERARDFGRVIVPLVICSHKNAFPRMPKSDWFFLSLPS